MGRWIFIPFTKQRDGAAKINQQAVVKDILLEPKEDKKNPRITPIPSTANQNHFLTSLYIGLSLSGVLPGGEAGIMNAVNITLRARKDLDDGKQWNGDIQIAENVKLKLYKSGLVLYTKR